jgi:hypothetical protein
MEGLKGNIIVGRGWGVASTASYGLDASTSEYRHWWVLVNK